LWLNSDEERRERWEKYLKEKGKLKVKKNEEDYSNKDHNNTLYDVKGRDYYAHKKMKSDVIFNQYNINDIEISKPRNAKKMVKVDGLDNIVFG
jgi:hypothetical protein